jgi:hypothetical protein
MKKLFAISALCWSTFSFAGGDTGFVSILSSSIQIISDGSPRAFIYVTLNNGGCANSTPELIMDSTNPLAGAMYATLLTAKSSGQTVDISTSGCTASGFPLVVSIYLGT